MAWRLQRRHAEEEYAHELAALVAGDDRPRPPGWRLSPSAVVTYLLGGEAADGTPIVPKYVGSRRLIEVAVATLTTDRALLLLGVPGTAKTWVSEHLAAAVSGDSTLLVQGTAGTPEEAIRYGWNYARLLADGPSRAALVDSPVLRAMATGGIARIEELTRMPSDVQDSLITVLSERTLPVPELTAQVQARKGFKHHRDRERPGPGRQRAVLGAAAPVQHRRAAGTGRGGRGGGHRVAPGGPARPGARAAAAARGRGGDPPRRHDLPGTARRRDRGRAHQAQDASGTLSTAEAISVVTNGLALATALRRR